MFELNGNNITSVKHLLNRENFHYPLLKSIINSTKKGNAYTDSLREPSIAGVLSDDGWFYLLENQSEADFAAGFSRELEEMLHNKIIVDDMPILWFGISNEWKDRMQQHVSLKVQEYPRNHYEFMELRFKPYSSNPLPYSLASISSKNIDQVFGEYGEDLSAFWQSKELFLKKGFGFILLDRNKIIGHSISASVEDFEVEIDIKTEENYQGKGIAMFLASCLINECLKRSLIPKWDCAVDNVPSNILALKLGFKKVGEYPFSIIQAT